MKNDNNYFERVEDLKYMGTNLTNHNVMQEEIKSRVQAGNACYHSVQNLLCTSLLYKNLSIEIYIIIILPAVFHGCKYGRSHSGRKEEEAIRE